MNVKQNIYINLCEWMQNRIYINQCEWMQNRIYINQCEWMQNRIYSKPHIKEEVKNAKNYETLVNTTNVTFKADSEQWTSLILITVVECDKIS